MTFMGDADGTGAQRVNLTPGPSPKRGEGSQQRLPSRKCLRRDAIMQFKKRTRITPHPQPLSHASGERGEKTFLLAPLPEFGEGPGVGSELRIYKLNCIIPSAVMISYLG